MPKPAAGSARAPEIHPPEAFPEAVLPYEAKEGTFPLIKTAAAAARPSTAVHKPESKYTSAYNYVPYAQSNST